MPNTERVDDCPRHYRIAWSVILLQLAWFASVGVSKLWFSQDLVPPGIYSWMVAIVPVTLAAFVLRSYIRYIRALDELWVKIYLRALGFSFGVSVLVLFTYPILELANAPKFDATAYGGFSLFVFFGAAFYCARRYS